jgi:hypothetical protein
LGALPGPCTWVELSCGVTGMGVLSSLLSFPCLPCCQPHSPPVSPFLIRWIQPCVPACCVQPEGQVVLQGGREPSVPTSAPLPPMQGPALQLNWTSTGFLSQKTIMASAPAWPRIHGAGEVGAAPAGPTLVISSGSTCPPLLVVSCGKPVGKWWGFSLQTRSRKCFLVMNEAPVH